MATSNASESGDNWTKNYKMGSKRVEDGTELVNAGPPVGYIWVKKYKYIPCCVPATDSDACNTSSQGC